MYQNSLYEAISTRPNEDEVSKYTKLIADTISIILHKGITIPNRLKVSRLMEILGNSTPDSIKDIKLHFIGSEWGYAYYPNTNTITLPERILSTKRMSKRDYIGLSHEIEHHFQHIGNGLHDEGTYSNEKLAGNREAYVNDRDEIDAMMGQIITYINTHDQFRDEIAEYDFEPFVETVISKILYEKDPTYYMDELLSQDNRNKLLGFLLLIWRKIKK